MWLLHQRVKMVIGAGRSGSNRRGGEDREPAPELIGVLPEILKLNYHQDKDQTD